MLTVDYAIEALLGSLRVEEQNLVEQINRRIIDAMTFRLTETWMDATNMHGPRFECEREIQASAKELKALRKKIREIEVIQTEPDKMLKDYFNHLLTLADYRSQSD